MSDRSPEKEVTESHRAPLTRNASGSYFTRAARTQGGVPPLPTSPGSPGTPRTPLRNLSSAFNSPGPGSFRTDDEIFVIELGSRFMRIGLGGEPVPRCCVSFGPETRKRPGDYSQWVLPPVQNTDHKAAQIPEEPERWGQLHTLYDLDLRETDLGLVSDQIERAVRVAMTDHVLVMDDSKRRSMTLALPPALPHPLLAILLWALFNNYPNPGQINLVSAPTMCTISAGLRTALVVDIGWAETLVTTIFELREISHRRSRRAMQRLSWEVACMAHKSLNGSSSDDGNKQDEQQIGPITLDEAEDIVHRGVWCRESASASQPEENPTISFPLISHPLRTLDLPFSSFSDPVERAFFEISTTRSPANPPSSRNSTSKPASAKGESQVDAVLEDDHLCPLPSLLYFTLLSLPTDLRAALLPRIIITSGGAAIPGLRTRIIRDLERLISSRGWDPVHRYGSTGPPPRRRGTVDYEFSPQRRKQQQDDQRRFVAGLARDRVGWDRYGSINPSIIQPGRKDAAPETQTHQNNPNGSAPAPDSSVHEKENLRPGQRTNKDEDENSSTPAHLQPPLRDRILERIHAQQDDSSGGAATPARRLPSPIAARARLFSPSSARDAAIEPEASSDAASEGSPEDEIAASEDHQSESGGGESSMPKPRLVETMGTWAGASLFSGLRVRGSVEIDKERFTTHGLAGAILERGGGAAADDNRAAKRQSMAAGTKAGDLKGAAGFSLGPWA